MLPSHTLAERPTQCDGWAAALQVVPGPNVDSINILRLVTSTWNMWHMIETTRPVLAPKMAAPRQVFNQLQYKTGVLVQAISTCSSFEVRWSVKDSGGRVSCLSCVPRSSSVHSLHSVHSLCGLLVDLLLTQHAGSILDYLASNATTWQ
jgi:hypothetical protein